MMKYDGKFEINGQEFYYLAKDDSNSSQTFIVKHVEHNYRLIEIFSGETGKSDTIMINTGDSFMITPQMVKAQFADYLKNQR